VSATTCESSLGAALGSPESDRQVPIWGLRTRSREKEWPLEPADTADLLPRPAPVPSPSGYTEDLLVRAGGGDHDAWRQLFEHISPHLHRIFHRSLPPELRPRTDTGELVQEGLFKAYRGAARFSDRGRGSARAWLVTLLSHVQIDFIRSNTSDKRDVAKECSGEGLFPQLAEHDDSPEELVQQAEAYAQLLLLVDRLPAEDREIVLRHTLEDQSFPSIGAELGLPSSTVADRYARALRQLRRWSGHG
jgi:RNA polymerase sigma factor (sigma-70 family)